MVPSGKLTDIEGLLVGHWTDAQALTGCTVVLTEEPFVASGEVRGGAPGTRETDLLLPGRLVERVDAIVLSGGSAFGLGAADGVMRCLRERGRGFPTSVMPVPIVPAAIIFDLALGRPEWPRPEAGYNAASLAAVEFECGCVGAGTGASVGKFLGLDRATKSGVGTACLEGPRGLRVGALAVVNALGSVVDPESGQVVAGARGANGSFVPFRETNTPYLFGRPQAAGPENTVVAVVATNARLDRSGAWRMAQVAHDGIGLAVRPAHTIHDGDTVFCLATGEVTADITAVQAMAVQALAAAIIHGVLAATGAGGLPAARDLARAHGG
ncbi:MAG: P1 family peptidase [Anaerolineae bacterium]|nr:P1 family peptidase [Anaerolineae bacterium]